jgi:tetratricopeptide (TPR) repeat protein
MNKNKKTVRLETRISGNSQSTFLSTRRNAFRTSAVLVILCTTISGVFSIRFLPSSNGQPLRIEEPSNQTEDLVQLPIIKPLSTKQDIVDLKKEEIELVRELLKKFPDSYESLTITGNLYHRHGDAIEAQKFWDESLKINPNQADVYNNIGWLYMKKGDFENAIAQFRKALKIDPELPDVHSNIGHALMISGRPKEAITDLKQELRISPKSDFANFLLGQVHMQLKEYQKARQYYETAIKITPEYTSAYYGLSTACVRLGDHDKAKEYSESFKQLKARERKDLKGRKIKYDDFVETQKSAAITYINVGRMYRENGNLTRAEELLKQAAGLDPGNVVCFLELATLYQLNNQPSKTLQMYKKISEIQPESSLPYFVIGMLSAQLKQYDDSEKAFRRLIELVPNKSDAYRELAKVYLKTNKNLPQARQLAEKAVAIKASADNYYILSCAFYSNGEILRALAAIQHALKLDPNNKQYILLYEHIQQRK